MASRLSVASGDTERSSVMIPAERNADNNLGRIPKTERKDGLVIHGLYSGAVAVLTGMRLAIVCRTCNHDIDVSARRLSPSLACKLAS